MHYFLNAFSRNDLNTIIPIVPVPFEVVHIGQVSRLSYEDKMQMRYLYQCSFGPRTAAQYQAVPCSADCPCWEDAFAECSFNYECQGDLVCTSDTIAPPTGCNDTPAYYSTEDSSGVMGPFDCDDPALDAGVGGTCQQGQTSDMCRNYCALPCPPTAAERLEEPSRMCRVGCVNNAQCPDDSAPVCFEGACIDGDPDAPTMNPTSFPTSSPTVSNGRNCPRGDSVFLFGCKG